MMMAAGTLSQRRNDMELKPCPFCGYDWREEEFGVFILCHDSTCVFGGIVHSAFLGESFVTKWNKRFADPLMKEMAEALTGLMANQEDVNKWIDSARVLKKYHDQCGEKVKEK